MEEHIHHMEGQNDMFYIGENLTVVSSSPFLDNLRKDLDVLELCGRGCPAAAQGVGLEETDIHNEVGIASWRQGREDEAGGADNRCRLGDKVAKVFVSDRI